MRQLQYIPNRNLLQIYNSVLIFWDHTGTPPQIKLGNGPQTYSSVILT